MANPFSVRWLAGWTFQTVLMEGHLQVEAHGFGICLRTPVLPGESPLSAADRLVLAEDQRRRTLHNAWLRGERLAQGTPAPSLSGARVDLQREAVPEVLPEADPAAMEPAA